MRTRRQLITESYLNIAGYSLLTGAIFSSYGTWTGVLVGIGMFVMCGLLFIPMRTKD